MKKYLLSQLFIFQCLISFAQGEGNHWYFGFNAGLDFSSGMPLPDLNGALSTWEGCSSVSDKNGNLLFYTDGKLVYNRNHSLMPNGTGLLGHSSSAQSAIIVKKPGADSIYFVFTTPSVSTGGFYYSEVNLNLDGGLGDIVLSTKNTNLLPLVGERVTATKHSNGIYTWVITKVTNTNAYHAFLVNCSGVQAPVITNIGLNAPGNNAGATVASPNCKKIASTFFSASNAIEILDFNNSTGVLSNPITQTQAPYPYGACFSTNSNLFYYSNIATGNVTQLNLNAGTGSSTDVLASAIVIGNISPGGLNGFRAGALQLASNGKIYMAENGQADIAVINNPDSVGTGCNFVGDAVSLGGKTSGLGLPTFFLNFLDTTVINYNNKCTNSSTVFSVNGDSVALDSVHWDFGDIASGSSNYSPLYSPSHIYSIPGNYTVQFIRYFPCGSDTNSLVIPIVPNVVAIAGGTVSLCQGETIQLNASGGTSYSWTGPANFTDTAQAISIQNASGSGLYIVSVKGANGCSDTAAVNVSVHPNALPAFSNTDVCNGNAMHFTDSSTSASGTISSWTWDFGDGSPVNTAQSPSYTFPAAGTYNTTLIVSNSFGCADTITKPVHVYYNPTAGFTHSDVCFGNTMYFSNTSSVDPSTFITTYLWVFGDGSATSNLQSPSHYYSTKGTYNVTLVIKTLDGCSDAKSGIVNVYDPPVSAFTISPACAGYDSTVFTNTSVNPTTGTISGWSWDFGDGASLNTISWNPHHLYSVAGNYQVTLITQSSNLGCSDTLETNITVYSNPAADFSSTDVCLNRVMSFHDSSTVPNGTISGWSWNFGDGSLADTSQNPGYTYSNVGTYPVVLTITTNNGCSDTIMKTISIHPLPAMQFATTNLCAGTAAQFTNLSSISSGTIASWKWNFADGSAIDPNYSTSHLYLANGSYPVQLIATSDLGCVDSLSKTVVVNPNPVAAFTASDTAGCDPFCVLFQNSSTIASGNNVSWISDFGDGSPLSNTPDSYHCYIGSSANLVQQFNFSFTVTSDSGCVTTLIKNNLITVYKNPVAEFAPSPAVVTVIDPSVNMINLSSPDVKYWYWDFGDGDTLSPDLSSPIHFFPAAPPSEYTTTLIVQNQYGCYDTIAHKISVEPEFTFYIPNAFSPNGDGINDYFFGSGAGILKYDIWIFDRWGNIIFRGKKLSDLWDGRGSDGKEIHQAEVLVWKVVLTDVFDRKHDYLGTVTIVR